MNSRIRWVALAIVAGGVGAAYGGPIPLKVWTWSQWENLSGSVDFGPSCVATAPNHLDCMAGVTGNQLSRRWWDGAAWNGWTPAAGLSIDSAYRSGPSCIAVAPDRVDCFVRGLNDSALYHRWWQTSGATWWESLDGFLTSDPSCVVSSPGRIDCFGRSFDGFLLQRSFDGNIWQPWTNLGGQVAEDSRPACVASGSGRIDCVVTWSDNTLRDNAFDGNFWSGWTAMQGGTVTLPFSTTAPASPKCTVSSSGVVICVAPFIDQSGYPGLHRWTKSGQTWGIADLGDDFGGSAAYQQLGPINSYDIECVARGQDRVDCIELVGRAQLIYNSPGAETAQFRQFWWDDTTASGWIDALRNVTNWTAETLSLSCTSWGDDRIDCFAAPGWLSSGPLLHIFYSLTSPILHR